MSTISICAQPQVHVDVRFEPVTLCRTYACGSISPTPGQWVVVEEEKCLEIGKAVRPPAELNDPALVVSGKLLRFATDDDRVIMAKNSLLAKQALAQAKNQVDRRALPMGLFHARYSFDRTRLTFQFTADGRVDFRDLLKDLAAMFKARIELRQVGAREETRVVGGFGPCGRRTCCSTFLADLKPISIKMAKDQGLHQNPNKVTGLCGKLMCCLKYEVDFYRQALADFPAVDALVTTDTLQGTVVYQNPVKGTVTISLAQGIMREIPVDDVRGVRIAAN